jgi:predicted DNA-binding protein YlxM (UPF0122 family)
MIKHDRINQLLDFYKPLLTEHQRTIAELHYAEDLSISEITEHAQSSRAAVHETLKRVEVVLEDYESALHLVEKHQKRHQLLLQLKQLNNPTVNDVVAKLDDLD